MPKSQGSGLDCKAAGSARRCVIRSWLNKGLVRACRRPTAVRAAGENRLGSSVISPPNCDWWAADGVSASAARKPLISSRQPPLAGPGTGVSGRQGPAPDGIAENPDAGGLGHRGGHAGRRLHGRNADHAAMAPGWRCRPPLAGPAAAVSPRRPRSGDPRAAPPCPAGRGKPAAPAASQDAPTAARASLARTVRSRPGGKARECGWEPAPSVKIATSGARPAATHAAIRPPQPRLSSSGCGASTRPVPGPMMSSRQPIGRPRQAR